ncbi:putative AC9 transposase, partial [Bienertia sinuspersici]
MHHQANLSSQPGPSVKRLLDNMKVKWCAYFTEFPLIYAIAAILDPGVKIEERICEDYGAVIQPQPVGSSMDASRFKILGPVLKKSRPDGSGSSSSSNIGIVLARIAKDILTIPASTIAFESAFSAGRRVLDEKRSHLSSESIEMC